MTELQSMSNVGLKKLNDPRGHLRQRVLLVGGILVYIACFQWMYVHWLYPTFGYSGFDYNPPRVAYLALAWILSVLPSLWMPMAIARPSQLAYWVLYLVAIIPSAFVPFYAGLDNPSEIAIVVVVLVVGFAITGLSYSFPLLKLPTAILRRAHFWQGFALLAGALAVAVIVAFRGQLQISSFADVYDVRSAADDVMEGNRLNYALMWLSGAIDPFMMGWGLYHKRPLLFLAGAMGQLLVYSSLGTKGSVISILFVLAIYLLVRGTRFPVALKLMGGVVGLLAALLMASVFVSDEQESLLWIALSVIFMRTFAINGLMTAWYYNFFQINPQTHLSHLNGVNLFIPYRYANPVGIEVGSYYSGFATTDANGHFWATDGLASFGLPGILLVSVFCALVFWILDSAARRHDPKLAALVISYAAYNLANIGIFTTFLSGGLGLLILLLYFMPGERSGVSASSRVLPTAVRSTA